MKTRVLAASVAISVFLSAPGAGLLRADTSATVARADCKTNAADEFDPGVAFASGPEKGKCLNTSSKRSIVVLSPEQKKKYAVNAPGGWVSFANFSHGGKFWIASLDPNGLDQAVFEIENFPAIVPAAHTFIRFDMKPGSELNLVEQIQVAGKEPQRLSITNFAVSIEAVPIPGDSYDLISGLQEHFGNAYRFLSMADAFAEDILQDHHEVRQYVLWLLTDDKMELLLHEIAASNERGMKEFYNTLTNSCTTEAFDILDQSVEYNFSHEVQTFFGRFILDQTYPNEGEIGLAVRELLLPDGRSSIANLDQDEALIDQMKHEGVYPQVAPAPTAQ